MAVGPTKVETNAKIVKMSGKLYALVLFISLGIKAFVNLPVYCARHSFCLLEVGKTKPLHKTGASEFKLHTTRQPASAVNYREESIKCQQGGPWRPCG